MHDPYFMVALLARAAAPQAHLSSQSGKDLNFLCNSLLFAIPLALLCVRPLVFSAQDIRGLLLHEHCSTRPCAIAQQNIQCHPGGGFVVEIVIEVLQCWQQN